VIFRHQRVMEYFLATCPATKDDNEIASAAQQHEFSGTILSLIEFPSLSLERAANVEKLITNYELNRRHFILAEELRQRLGRRWKRERGIDPYRGTATDAGALLEDA
jgi:hypothetical protein